MSLGPLTKNNSLLLYALLVQLLVFYAWEAHLGPFFIHLNPSVSELVLQNIFIAL